MNLARHIIIFDFLRTMSHLLCGSFSDEEVDPHWCICDKLKACNLTPYNVYLDGFTLFLENRRTFKTTKYKLFSTFLQQFECFYIRLFSRLALMCEMENATVTTLQGCESKFRYRSNRYEKCKQKQFVVKRYNSNKWSARALILLPFNLHVIYLTHL